MEIPAPEALEFDSYDAAETYIYQHARENGYALSQGPKRLDKRIPPTIRRADFRCDKGGKIRGQGVVRNSSSRMTECPFDLRLMRMDMETGRWKIAVADPKHNHPPSDDLRQHPLYRRLQGDEKQRIDQLHQAGVPPRMIVSALRTENPHSSVRGRLTTTRLRFKRSASRALLPLNYSFKSSRLKTPGLHITLQIQRATLTTSSSHTTLQLNLLSARRRSSLWTPHTERIATICRYSTSWESLVLIPASAAHGAF